MSHRSRRPFTVTSARIPRSSVPVRLGLVAAGALLLGTAPSAELVLEGQAPAVVQDLKRNHVAVLADGGGPGSESLVVALVLFDQPRARVTGLLREAERQTEYRPELVAVRTVTARDGQRVDEQRIRILFHELVYRVRYREDSSGRLSWDLDQGFENDLARMRGFWEFYEFEADPGRTLGRFGSDVDVGRAVPRFVQKGLGRKTVFRYVENLRRWIDSDGTWRP